jgi:hypothetical protein
MNDPSSIGGFIGNVLAGLMAQAIGQLLSPAKNEPDVNEQRSAEDRQEPSCDLSCSVRQYLLEAARDLIGPSESVDRIRHWAVDPFVVSQLANWIACRATDPIEARMHLNLALNQLEAVRIGSGQSLSNAIATVLDEAYEKAREQFERQFIDTEHRAQLDILRSLLDKQELEARRALVPYVLAGMWRQASSFDLDLLTRLGAAASDPEQYISARSDLFPRRGDRISLSMRQHHLLGSLDLLTGTVLRHHSQCILECYTGSRHSEASSFIREGLAEGLLLLSWLDQNYADYVGRVVWELLDSSDTERWARLSDVLPILAEASPNAFIRICERSFQMVDGLRSVFQDDVLFTKCGASICSALEVLCWMPNTLLRSCLILSQIACIRERPKLGRTAIDSLVAVFQPILGQTLASREDRAAVLDELRKLVPVIYRQLLLRLLPRGGGILDQNSRPRSLSSYRHPHQDRILLAELYAEQELLLDRIIEILPSAVDVAVEAIDSIHAFASPDLQQRLASAIVAISDRLTEDHALHTRAIRKLVETIHWEEKRHEDHSSLITAASLAQLKICLDRLQRETSAYAISWMFSWTLDQLEIEHPKELRDAMIQEKRADAVQRLLAAQGPLGLIELIEIAELPSAIAPALLAGSYDLGQIIELLLSPLTPNRKSVLSALSRLLFLRDGIEPLLAMAKDRSRKNDFDGSAILLTGLPGTMDTWGAARQLGPDVESSYWRTISPYSYEGMHVCELAQFAEGLRSANRWGDCVTALAYGLRQLSQTATRSSEEAQPLLDLLHQMAPHLGEHGIQFSHEIGDLLAHLFRFALPLASRLSIEQELAQYLHGRTGYHFPAHREAMSEADFFVQVLSWLYQPLDEDQDDGGEQTIDLPSTERSTIAFDVLEGIGHEWKHPSLATLPREGDCRRLRLWIDDVVRLSADGGIGQVGALKAGEILSRSPLGADGVFPCECVREILECADLSYRLDLEEGFIIGVLNSRGAWTKGWAEGGKQERELASVYNGYADCLGRSAPLVADLLRRIGDIYSNQSRREDYRTESM